MSWTSFLDVSHTATPATKWGWFVALGLFLVALGLIAAADIVAVTFASVIVIGLMMIIGGASQIIHALMVKRWRGAILGLLLGALYVVAGAIIIREPVRGAILLTLVISIMIVLGGIFRIVLALQHREIRAWGLLLLSGVVSLAVGALIYASLPWSGLWILGALVAVELIMQGIGWFFFGVALRSLQGIAAPPRPQETGYGRA